MKIRLLSRTNIGSIAGLLAALGAPAVAADTGAAAPHPKIEVQNAHEDAGTFEEGTVVPFQFSVANRGQADLELSQVKPGCGCTVAKWDRVIKPGGHGTIAAEVNTQSFRGAVTKHLTVFSNDPEQPQLELLMTAHLLPLVKVSPSSNALLTVGEMPVTHEFTLERNEGRPMKIIQVVPNAPYLKVDTTPLPGQGRYRLAVTVTPDAPLGRSTVPVAVWTDLEKANTLTLIVTVDRGIVCIPPLLFFGVVPQELPTPRLAIVTLQRSSTPFHIQGVAVHDPRLTAKVETVRDGAEYRVTLSYAGGWDAGAQRQTVTVTTDDPKQPTLEIPVQAAVQAKIARSSPPAAVH